MNKNINIQTVITQTNEDFKASILIVSVAVNMFVFTAWLVAQVSAEYAAQLVTLI